MRSVAASMLALTLMAAGQPVLNADEPPDVTDSELAATISDLELPVEDLKLPEGEDVVTERSDHGQRVIDLTADILFAFNSAEVVPSGSVRIAELVRDLPQASPVAIGGHTDSVGDDASNLTLSQQRAESVAAIVRAARPDLVLTVTGYGESQPIAPNTNGGTDNPEGRAQNRRVELRVG